MKSTKLLSVLFLLFISITIFAQKVHYKDSYYTIVKSKIFHRGHDVYGQLTPGKIDTIHTIAKELYNEKGKLKDKYKKRKKRDRYKLPEGFWEQKSGTVAGAMNTNENKATETASELGEAENLKDKTVIAETNKSATTTAPIITKEKVLEKAQKEDETEPKKTTNISEIEKKEPEKEEKSVHEVKKSAVVQEKNAQQKEEDTEKIAKRKSEKEKRVKAQKEKVDERKDEKAIAEKKEEKSLTKEKRDAKKSSGKKRAQEANKLENKKKGLERKNNTQLKKQKSLEAKAAALASVNIVSTPFSSKETFGTIYIKVNKEKTNASKDGAILLFFDVINNSNKDLVILKPNNTMDSRLDFFMNIMECEDVPIIATDYIAKELKIKEEDYLTIPANAKIELFVNGTYRNWLACSSEYIILQIQYNPFKSAEEGIELLPALKKEISKALKSVTPIKIESENIKFKLNN